MSDSKTVKASLNFVGMLKLGVILALYASAACVGLAFVYAGTARVIAERQEAEQDAALKELFPDADGFRPVSGITSPDPLVIIEEDKDNPASTGAYAAMKNGALVGLALRTSRPSYSGPIKILVGVSVDGKISGVKILEHSDTPGLGANAVSKTYYVDRARGIRFYDQFAGKDVGDPFESKHDIIAITAATITSQAVASSVKAAGEAALAWFGAGGLQ